MPEWWNGRHSRLKICRIQKRTGSSPVSGTINYIVKENGCVHQPSVIQCNIGECRLIVELSSAITLTEAETTNHRLSGLSNKRPGQYQNFNNIMLKIIEYDTVDKRQ